jgi:molybdenum cofactor biosynthesis enzyme
MLKALDKEMVISDICVTEKRGGKADYKKSVSSL